MTGADRSDDALMTRARTGDADAFEVLYRRHAELASRVAMDICRDAGRAEEAVQEAFLSIWCGRARYRSGGGFRAWSMAIVRHRAIDSLRYAATRPQVERRAVDWEDVPIADPEAISPLDQVMRNVRREAVLASIKGLPSAQAEVIVLAFYGQMSYSEVAARLSLPTGTVKGRARHGMKNLRATIEAPGA